MNVGAERNPNPSNGSDLSTPPTHSASASQGASLVPVVDAGAGRSGYLVSSLHYHGTETGTGAPGLSGTPSMSALMQALRRRWLLALGLALAGAGLTVAAVLFLFPAKYVAQVRLQVSSRGEAPVFGGGNPEETEFAIYKANMAAMVKSPWVLNAALNQKTAQGQPIKDLSIVRDKGAGAVDWLEMALKTDFLLGPEILRVTLAGDKPDEVASLLNAVAKAFVEENDQRESARRQQRMEQLAAKQRELESELGELRKQARVLEKENKLEDKETRHARYAAALAKLAQYDQAVLKNSLDQISAREEVSVLKDRLTKIDKLPVSEEKLDEGLKISIEAKGVYKQLEDVEFAIQQIRLTAKPELVQGLLTQELRKKDDLRKRLIELREQLRPDLERQARAKAADEMSERLVKLTDNLTSLVKQEEVLTAEYGKVQSEVAKLAPAAQSESPTLVNLRDKVSTKQASLELVAKTITLMRAEVQNPRVTLMQAANEPSAKDMSRQTKLGGAGAVAMFLVVLFSVAFVEYRSGKISAADEVAQGLGLSVVGTLPARPRGTATTSSARPHAANQPAARSAKEGVFESQLTEAVDGIRTMLLHAARTENLRVIMISSAAVGEGKTTLASQLASSLARAWRKTLLVDGDLRSPAAHEVFGLPGEPGFSEVLRGELEAAAAIQPTSLGRLWLLPAGRWDSHAVQALAQDQIRNLMEELKQQYDFIIVDSAPLLPVTDSLLLGQHVDGVLLSVLRDVSRAPAVAAAQQKLHQLAIRTLGAVVIGAGDNLGKLGYTYVGAGRG